MAARSLVAGLLVALAGWAAIEVHSRQRVADAFPSIIVGQHEMEVRAVLGEPDWVAAPLPSHWCDETPVSEKYATAKDRQCVKQLGFDSWPPGPDCLTVCFGPDNRVVSKYHYVSP